MQLSGQRLAIAVLVLSLAVSLGANLLLAGRAGRTLFTDGDRPLIERTVAHFARVERTSAATIEAESFPIVMRIGDRTCVELRRHDGQGHKGACYDLQGRLVQETTSVVN